MFRLSFIEICETLSQMHNDKNARQIAAWVSCKVLINKQWNVETTLVRC
jgi:hypothetical protein